MTKRLAKKATIYSQKHRSGNLTWIVHVGKNVTGKNDLRRFESQQEAENFKNEWNLKLVNQNLPELQDLNSISRHEILAAVKRLELVDATLPEAVDFFLKYARPSKGKIKVEDAKDLFFEKNTDLSDAYLESMKTTYLKPFANYFKDRIVNEISTEEIEKYIKSHTKWGSETIRSNLTCLSVFYNFLIRQKYAKLNPITSIKRPRKIDSPIKLLSVEHAQSLLQFAYDNGYKKECASMALVFFCGVRVDEVSRLTWIDNINLDKKVLRLEANITKKARRRINSIPDNAIHWLNLCKDTGKVAPDDYDQRMKRLRNKTGIIYPQNGMRHSFTGYHLAMFNDAPKTSILLGHPNPKTLYSTYHEVTSKEDAEKFWAIVPKSVADKQKLEAQAQDDKEREEAEAQSNCGEAFRDENGEWLPVIKE
jgi:site-specific recombinase XerC